MLKRKIKGIFSICVAFVVFSSSFLGTTIETKAKSDSLVPAYISLMRGQSITDVEDIKTFTKDDLRVISLFLSNFYVPYYTTLDGNSDNKTKHTEYMTSMLSSLGLTKDSANQLVSTAFDTSLNSASKLYFKISELEDLDFDDNNGKVKYDTAIMMGYTAQNESDMSSAVLDVNKISNNINENYNYGMAKWSQYKLARSFVYLDEGVVYPVVTMDTIKSETYNTSVGGSELDSGYTPATLFVYNSVITKVSSITNATDSKKSASVYYKNSSGEFVDVLKINSDFLRLYVPMISALPDGVGTKGNALFNFNIKDGKTVETLSDDEIKRSFIYYQTLYVDWVGNIICDFGNERTVIVPACTNNRVFGRISANNNTSNMTNLTSTWGIWALGNNKVVMDNKKLSTPFTLSGDTKKYNLVMGYDKSKWYTVRGSRDPKFENAKMNEDGSFQISGLTESMESMLATTWYGSVSMKELNSSKKISGVPALMQPTGNTSNYLDEFLVWDKTKASSIDATNYKADGFLTSNITALPSLGSLFTSIKSFDSSGTDMGQLLGYTSQDSEIMKNLFLTYVYAYNYKDIKSSSFSSSNIVTNIRDKATDIITGLGDSITNKVSEIKDSLGTALDSIGNTTGSDDSNTETDADSEVDSEADSEAEADVVEESVTDETLFIDMRFLDIFPQVTGSITWTTDTTAESMGDEVLTFAYYFFHPTQGIAYVATLLKNKITGFLLDQHSAMVGGSNSNLTTGMTKYLGTSGYTTIPNLQDMSWTAYLLNQYDSLIIYLIVMIMLLIVAYIILGALTLQRGMLGVIGFAIAAFLPPIAIMASVNVTNEASNTIFSKKFNYWAYSQMQGYMSELDSMSSISDVNSYVDALISNSIAKTKETTGGIGGDAVGTYSGVKVKWQSPKRMNESAQLTSGMKSSLVGVNYSASLFNMFGNADSASGGTQVYLESDTANYLYRDYMDIYRYAAVSYNLYETTTNNISNYSALGTVNELYPIEEGSSNKVGQNWTDSSTSLTDIVYSSGSSMSDYVMSNLENSTYFDSLSAYITNTSSVSHMRAGFILPLLDTADNTNYYSTDTLAVSYFLRFSDGMRSIQNTLNRMDSELGEGFEISGDVFPVYGIASSRFKMSLMDLLSNRDSSNLSDDFGEHLGYYFYALYSESPFYYFNFNVRDQLRKYTDQYTFKATNLSDTKANFKDLFLRDGQDYFYNLTPDSGDGFGELRDFMNMHDFFYYVVPSLQRGVDVVDFFDARFGMSTNSDCSLKVSSSGQITYNGKSYNSVSELKEDLVSLDLSKEDLYKLWHDINVYYMFNCYTPWLDIMNDCEYSRAETIKVAGEKFIVHNPVDPTSYYKVGDNDDIVAGRYMVFSRSEMAYYGLKESDLTQVERKIINVQDNVYANSIDLLNYYTLSDEVLIQAYSMLQLFEFNKEFSETNLFTGGNLLYPQGYELKAFTYDTYLRLIVAQASGESISSGNESIYTRVSKNTSMFFPIALLVNDILAVYLIPLLRIMFVVIIFLLSIVLLMLSAAKLKLNILSVLLKSVATPMLGFCVASVALSFLVSLFMSSGYQGVTQNSMTISLGDPTMALLLMMILNVGILVIYIKIVIGCAKDLWKNGKALATSAFTAVTGVASRIKQAVTGGKNGENDASDRTEKSGKGGKLGAAVGAGLAIAGLSKVGGGLTKAAVGTKRKLKPKYRPSDGKLNQSAKKEAKQENKYAKQEARQEKKKEDYRKKKGWDTPDNIRNRSKNIGTASAQQETTTKQTVERTSRVDKSASTQEKVATASGTSVESRPSSGTNIEPRLNSGGAGHVNVGSASASSRSASSQSSEVRAERVTTTTTTKTAQVGGSSGASKRDIQDAIRANNNELVDRVKTAQSSPRLSNKEVGSVAKRVSSELNKGQRSTTAGSSGIEPKRLRREDGSETRQSGTTPRSTNVEPKQSRSIDVSSRPAKKDDSNKG